MFLFNEWKSAALDCLTLKLQVPIGVLGGMAMVAEQTFGSDPATTGVIVTDAFGSGLCG